MQKLKSAHYICLLDIYLGSIVIENEVMHHLKQSIPKGTRLSANIFNHKIVPILIKKITAISSETEPPLTSTLRNLAKIIGLGSKQTVASHADLRKYLSDLKHLLNHSNPQNHEFINGIASDLSKTEYVIHNRSGDDFGLLLPTPTLDGHLSCFINLYTWYLENLGYFMGEPAAGTVKYLVCLSFNFTSEKKSDGKAKEPYLNGSIQCFISNYALQASKQRVVIPLFYHLHPKERFVMREEVPEEYMIGPILDTPKALMERTQHVTNFWKSWGAIGFPIECAQEFLLQTIREALGFEGNQSKDIASAPYLKLRKATEPLRPVGNILESLQLKQACRRKSILRT